MQMRGHPTLSRMMNLDSFVTRRTEREEEERRRGANDSRCKRGRESEAIKCSEGQGEEWPLSFAHAAFANTTNRGPTPRHSRGGGGGHNGCVMQRACARTTLTKRIRHPPERVTRRYQTSATEPSNQPI